MAWCKTLGILAWCTTFIVVAALLSAPAVEAADVASSRMERSANDEETVPINVFLGDTHVKVDDLPTSLEYELIITMINYGRDVAKVAQKTYLPDGAEIKSHSLEMSRVNGTRRKREAEQEKMKQWAGGVVNIQPGYKDTSDMVYINHPAEIIVANSKTFHRLAATVKVFDNNNLVGGEISTPNYPGNYPNGADISWTIVYPPENVVVVQMLDYSMEECCDHLTIYDGFNKSSSVLATYDGDSQSGTTSIVESTKSSIFIRFTSDCLTSGRGFRASYINRQKQNPDVMTTPNALTPEATTAQIVSCGSVQQNSSNSGTVTSPNYPGNYANYMNCSWGVQTYYGTKVRFTVQTFNLQSGDYLYIYDGPTYNQGQLLAALSGYKYSGYTVTANSNQASLLFTSDYSSGYGYGYGISYEGITYPATTKATDIEETSAPYYNPGECSASNTYLYNSGDIISPGYYTPAFYPPNEYCTWMVQVYSGYVAQFSIHIFDIEHGYDWVRIYNGFSTSSSAAIVYLTGYISPNTNVATSNSRYATVTFSSDHIVNDRGFNIHYSYAYPGTTASPTTDAPEMCSSPTYEAGTYGYVSSPNYPSFYSDNLNCSYSIQTPYYTVVRLTVQSFSLGSGDYLRIYDGYDGSFIRSLYGNVSYGYYVQAYSNYVRMTFTTNSYDTSSGFDIRYNAISNSYYTTEPSIGNSYDTTIPTDSGCGDNMYGDSGTILSPSYGTYPYQNNLDCIWTMQVYYSKYVLFTVEYFRTENCCDFVYFCRGSPSNSYGCPYRLQGTVSTGTEVIIQDNDAYITFHTDGSVTENGFNITYSAVDPSYVVEAVTGSSPYTTSWWRHNEEEPAGKIKIIGRDLWAGAKNRPTRREKDDGGDKP